MPPWPGGQHFVQALEALVHQPRRGPSVLVALTETSPEDSVRALLRGERFRLTGERGRLVPYALIEPPEPGGVADQVSLLATAAADLRVMPRHTGRLRLRRYELLRGVAEAAGLHPGDPDRRATELRERLRRGGEPLPDDDEGPGGVILSWLLWIWKGWFGPWVFRRRVNRLMTGRGRRGWFSDWVNRRAGEPSSDFFTDAQRLAPGGVWGADAGEVLLWALLADLDEALRPRLLSPWRGRRSRFVLLAHAGSGTSELVAAYRRAVKGLGSQGTVLVAHAGVSGVPEATGFLDAARILRDGPNLPEGPLELAVSVPPLSEARDEEAEDRFRFQQRAVAKDVPAWPPGVGLALRLGALALVPVMLVVGLRMAGVDLPPLSDPLCPDGQFEDSHDGDACLGLSDGGEGFPGMGKEFDELFTMIEETNGAVADLVAAEGRQVRTVVHFAQFTAESTAPEAVGSGTFAELRGLALAQREIRQNAVENEGHVLLRVLLANSGPGFRDAEPVAEEIVRRADDEDIIGVVGPGESRTETFAAMRILGDGNIPMVGTTANADGLIEQSRLFYQLAPTNARQARVAASFLEHTELITLPEGPVRAEAAAVIYYPDDVYSDNLASDFRESFPNGEVTMLAHQSAGTGGPDGTRATFDDLAEQVCGLLVEEPATLVFWVGREGDLTAFLSDFGPIPECGGRITVLGADTVASALSEETNPVERHSGLTLYYLAHAVPSVHRPTPAADRFFEVYEEEFGPLAPSGPEALASGDAALGRDALMVLADAARAAYDGHDAAFDRSTVRAMLDAGQVDIQGVTGVLSFDDGRVPRDKPVYILRGSETTPEIVLDCGAFASDDERTTWGNGHPCPRD